MKKGTHSISEKTALIVRRLRAGEWINKKRKKESQERLSREVAIFKEKLKSLFSRLWQKNVSGEERRECARQELLAKFGEDMPEKYPYAYEYLLENNSKTFFEKNESIIARVVVFVLCCAGWALFLHVALAEVLSGDGSFLACAFLWVVFITALFAVLREMPMRFSSFPFLRARCLKNKPVLRAAIGVFELLCVALFFFAMTFFALWFSLLVFCGVALLVAAAIGGIRRLL